MKETIVKINKTKRWFSEKIKLTSLQPDSQRKKETRIKSTKLEMKKERLQQTIRSDQTRSVTQSCPTLSDPMDCSLPGFSVHFISKPGKDTTKAET